MKNIHILPTDKPSSIGYDGVKNLHFVNDFIDDYQNIYITSDEEIKEGDWCYNPKSKETIQAFKKYPFIFIDCKKIILTTDQDLIKDNVQAIDDEFLEWFVKNPSCEEVEVIEQYRKCCRNTDGKNENCIEPINCEGWLSNEYEQPYKTTCEKRFEGYKIIIPKEEPKQCDICKMYPRIEGTNKCESCYSVVRYFLEQDLKLKGKLLPDLRKKQETLEKITEQIQNECHIFVESVTNVTYQDATNTFLFMKLAELTLKLKKYE